VGDRYLLTPHGCWLLDPGVAQRVRNSSGQQMCDCTVGSASGLTFFRIHERIRRWWLVAWGRLRVVPNFFFLLSLFICIPCIINMIQGFHLGLRPFLNPLLILCYSVCVEVSPLHSLPTTVCTVLSIRLLCSLPTTVCVTVSNIVHQVTVLPAFTDNLHCCASDCCALFLQQ